MSYVVDLEFLDEVFFKIEAPFEVYSLIANHFTVFAENYKYHPKYKNRVWNGKICIFDRKNYTFPIGLLPELFSLSKKYNFTLNYKFDLSKIRSRFSPEDVNKVLEKIYEVYPTEFKLLDYQIEAIQKSIKSKRGICELPTSSRKSGIIYHLTLFFRAIKNPTLIIVPSVGLVEQLYGNFLEYGWKDLDRFVTKMHSHSKPDLSKNILITTYQSLEGKPKKFFEKYKSLIVDECQSAKTKTLKGISEKCTNAEYRIGFTGTLPKEPINYYTIFANLGPVIIRRKTRDLINKGIISDITIKNILLKYPLEFIKANKNRPYHEELKEVLNYSNRNSVIDHIIGTMEEGQNLLLLCQFREHFKAIKDYLEKNYGDRYKIKLINGLVKAQERESIRTSMEEESNVILLGSFQTISEGFSVKKIHVAAFLSSYKAEIKIIQAIGRALRQHSSKSCAVLFDVCDDLRYKTSKGTIVENTLYRHWKQRVEYYEQQKHPYETIELKLQ